MAKLKPELKAILDRYKIDYTDKDKIWDCHGTLVLYHKAYEVIAAQENITFDPPTVIEGRSGDKIVALLVRGHMGDRSEWSIGEAAPGNNKNSYPYAMAEKRAKDRVIAKLVGLSAYVYSEDEADEFKTGARAGVEQDGGGSAGPKRKEETADTPHADSPPPAVLNWVAAANKAIRDAREVHDLVQWREANKAALAKLQAKHQAEYSALMIEYDRAKVELVEINMGTAA